MEQEAMAEAQRAAEVTILEERERLKREKATQKAVKWASHVAAQNKAMLEEIRVRKEAACVATQEKRRAERQAEAEAQKEIGLQKWRRV